MPNVQADYRLLIDGRELTTAQKRYVTDVELEESFESGRASTLQFRITGNRFGETGVRLKAQIKFGIASLGETPLYWFQGVITNVQMRFPQDDAPHVIVECSDFSYYLKTSGREAISLPFEGIGEKVRWRQIVEQILSIESKRLPVDFRLWVSPGDALDLPVGDTESIIYGGYETRKEETPISGLGVLTEIRHEFGDTPWQALNKIAEKCQLRLIFCGPWLLMVDRNFFFPGQYRSFDLVYGQPRDMEGVSNTIPLLEFDVESSAEGNRDAIRTIAWVPNAPEGAAPEIVEEEPRNDVKMPTIGGKEETSRYPDIGVNPGNTLYRMRLSDLRPVDSPEMPQDNVGPGAYVPTAEEHLTQQRYEQAEESNKEIRDAVLLRALVPTAMYVDMLLQKAANLSNNLSRIGSPGKLPQIGYGEELPLLYGVDRLPIEKDVLEVSNTGAETPQEAERISKALLEKMIDRLTTGSGRIAGNPLIRAGHKHTIRLSGLGEFGRLYTGEYLFTSTRHRISEDGYFTEFEVSRPFVLEADAEGEVTQ